MERKGRWEESKFGRVGELDHLTEGRIILRILSDDGEPPHFHPEFGRFMLEATPAKPWGIDFKDLLKVESNMKRR